MDGCIWAELHVGMYVCIHICSYMHTAGNSRQYVFQLKNPLVIIDVKE